MKSGLAGVDGVPRSGGGLELLGAREVRLTGRGREVEFGAPVTVWSGVARDEAALAPGVGDAGGGTGLRGGRGARGSRRAASFAMTAARAFARRSSALSMLPLT